MLNSRVRRGGPWLRLLMSVAVGIVIGAGALVFARTEMTSLRYRLSHLLEAESELRAQVDKLRVEVAALSAPERVEPRAVELGMMYPRPGQVIDLPHVGDGPKSANPKTGRDANQKTGGDAW